MPNQPTLQGFRIDGTWNFDRTLIWVGAGISYPTPTCLPLGSDLTAFTLEETCGALISKKILRVWDKVTKTALIRQGVELGQIPRLEAILDVIRKSEISFLPSTYSFFSGFHAFALAPPNFIHYHLATLINEGATVITPNFDLCIEKAWEYLFESATITSTTEFGLIRNYLGNKSMNGQVWHYHGIGTDPDTLGATVMSIKAGFSQDLKNHLIEKINRCETVIFIGYSFSDGFDVNPFFLSLPDSFFDHTKAIFIKHVNGEQLSKLSTPINAFESQWHDLKRIKRVLACFTIVEFYQGDTRNFFDEAKVEEVTTFDWKNTFKLQSKLSDLKIVKPLMICSLTNYLGFNVNLIQPNITRRVRENSQHYDKVFFIDQLTQALRRQGLSVFEKKYHLEKAGELGKTDLLGYYYSRSNYSKAQEYAVPLELVEASINNSEQELSWVQFTSLASYCRPIVMHYVQYFFERHVSIKHKSMIRDLQVILGKINSKSLQSILNVNQLGTSLRFQFLFHTLDNNGDISNALLRRAIDIYSENTSIPGYISVFRDIAINYFLAAKLFGRKDCFSDSFKYAKTSLLIAHDVLDIPGFLRALSVLIYIGVEKFLSFVLRNNE